MPGHIQGVYVQNILKLFTRLVTGYLETKDYINIQQRCDELLKKLPSFISSGHIEVQERASSAFVLVQMLRDQFPTGENLIESEDMVYATSNADPSSYPLVIDIVQEMAILFAGDLNPVAPKAQRKVPVPDGLDLDAWINAPLEESSSSSEDEQTDLFVPEDNEPKKHVQDLSPEEMERVREARRVEQSHNVNYLKSSNSNKERPTQSADDGLDDIPIAELALEVPLKIICKTRRRIDKFQCLRESNFMCSHEAVGQVFERAEEVEEQELQQRQEKEEKLKA